MDLLLSGVRYHNVPGKRRRGRITVSGLRTLMPTHWPFCPFGYWPPLHIERWYLRTSFGCFPHPSSPPHWPLSLTVGEHHLAGVVSAFLRNSSPAVPKGCVFFMQSSGTGGSGGCLGSSGVVLLLAVLSLLCASSPSSFPGAVFFSCLILFIISVSLLLLLLLLLPQSQLQHTLPGALQRPNNFRCRFLASASSSWDDHAFFCLPAIILLCRWLCGLAKVTCSSWSFISVSSASSALC